jgi:hypothetical protein
VSPHPPLQVAIAEFAPPPELQLPPLGPLLHAPPLTESSYVTVVPSL